MEIAQPVPKSGTRAPVEVRRIRRQKAYPPDLHCFLRLSGERRKTETDSENDRDLDQPHAAGSLAEGHDAHQRPGLACTGARWLPQRATWLENLTVRARGPARAIR